MSPCGAAGAREAARAGIRLASIHIYPMKAGRAVDVGQSLVEPWGLAGDRRWLLVDEDGRCVTQREAPSLARVTVTYGRVAGLITSLRPVVPAAGSLRRPPVPGRKS